MRCFICNVFSFFFICKKCQLHFLKPEISIRKINNIKNYSFYKYSEIDFLMKTKYQIFGSTILNILANNSLKEFANLFKYLNRVYAIPIDDNVQRGYSHTAILANNLKSKYITPIYSTLRAKNKIKYANQSLEFRKKHKRDFQYTGKKNIDVIIVDDIITTSTTILEAKNILEKKDVNVLFSITLSDSNK